MNKKLVADFKEIQEKSKLKPEVFFFTTELENRDSTKWKVCFNMGDKKVICHLSFDNYPFTAPAIQFTPAVYHPNINPDNGSISLPIVREWKITDTILNLVTQVKATLTTPISSDCDVLNKECMQQYMKEPKQFQVKFSKSLEQLK